MLDFFGLFSVDTLYVILGMAVVMAVMLVFLIINSVKIKKMKLTYTSFMSGKDGKSLEEVILKRFKEVDELKKEDAAKKVQLDDVNESLRYAFSKMGMVKYDAFNEMGGKLSFALALLDNRNNGFLINAMHSREGCYTYVKEIINGESYINLGEEEKKALNKAINSESGDE
ncbi:MAG: DUF4446 family protein [Butyrivibrio crossotus]|nr:DUF4446 family protein [Butyrivibrio crossotus]MDY4029270.1 DUF4446 family protein [Butyrivibrio crossotus]